MRVGEILRLIGSSIVFGTLSLPLTFASVAFSLFWAYLGFFWPL